MSSRLEAKKNRLAELRSARKAISTSAANSPVGTPARSLKDARADQTGVHTPHTPAADADGNARVDGVGEPSPCTPKRSIAQRLDRLSTLRQNRARRSGGSRLKHPGLHGQSSLGPVPAERPPHNPHWSILSQPAADPADPAETEGQPHALTQQLAHANEVIRALRHTLAGQHHADGGAEGMGAWSPGLSLSLSQQGNGSQQGRSRSPEEEVLSEENAMLRARVSELESVPSEQGPGLSQGPGLPGPAGLAESSAESLAVLPSAESFLVAHRIQMGHDLVETPNRERTLHGGGGGGGDTAVDRLAELMMNDEVAEWVMGLAASGANIGQIVTEQADHLMEITELYDTVEDFKEELDSLNGQLRQSRENGQQSEEYLREYEAENEKLLRDFKALEERDAMHGHHRLGSPTGPKSSMDSAELENLRHNLKQKDVELQTAANELARLVAAHEETLQSHASSRQISTNNESYAEELEEELRAVAAERDEALHSLQMVVKEIEGEEERFENELELQRSITVTKSQSLDRERREMGHQILALEEERAELLRQLEHARDDRRRSGFNGSNYNTSPVREQPLQEQSLFAELADTSNECADCLDWQQKLDLAKGQQKNGEAKMARLEADLADRSTLLDQVISKWTAAVASFTMHREGDPSCPCGDCTLNRDASAPAAANRQPVAPPTPEQHQAKERKKRRGLRWRSFVPGMKSSDRPDRPDARETKSLAETRGAPGKRGGKPPGGAVRGSVGRGQPIPSTGSSARTASATGRHRGLKPAAESFTSTGHPGPGGAVAGPERHTKLDQRQHNPGSKQRLPQRAAGKR